MDTFLMTVIWFQMDCVCFINYLPHFTQQFDAPGKYDDKFIRPIMFVE